MTIEDIQTMCKNMKHVTEEIKWETHLCYCVGGKIFIITSPDDTPVSASFKVSDEDFMELSEREGCKPAPYLAKHKWIYVDDIKRFKKKEWQKYLQTAYGIIADKLPAKMKKQLGIQ